jgi:hypothetical protein
MGKFSAPVEDHLILPAVASLPSGREFFLRQAGQPVPPPVPVRLLIDTGSKRTTLIPGVILHLDAPGGHGVQVVAPTGILATTLYWVRLEFPATGLAPFELVQVARVPMPPQLAQFHGLLGRDLLQRWASLDYEGQRGCYTLRDRPGLFAWLRRWL